MALTNHERVGKAMELLKAGLAPFAEREVMSELGAQEGKTLIASFADGPGLVVKAEVALKQLERESRPVQLAVSPERIELARNATCRFTAKAFDADGRGLRVSQPQWSATGGTIDQTGQFVAHAELGQFSVEVSYQRLHAQSTVVVVDAPAAPPPPPVSARQLQKRFHGSVVLDSERVGRDAGRIAEEVISHLTVHAGAKVTVTLEIQAELPAGAEDALVRTVTENCRTLKFSGHGFERE